MNNTRADNNAAVIKLVLAFAAVYIIWGSTYLAIRYAIETLPPLLMAGSRFLIAGMALFIWARARGAKLPDLMSWRRAALIGALLLLGGNGLVVLAERSVPSGLAALLIATEPLMIVILDWIRPGGVRPIGKVAIGLMIGFAGMILLVGPTGIVGNSTVDPFGAVLLVFASLSWATGSLYAARSRTQTEPAMGAAIQMVTGGALLLVTGFARGEAAMFAVDDVSLRSLSAFGYLVIFGSLVGFTCYSWLLRVTRPSLASTYAYVNPVVAVLLGWAFAGEIVTVRTLIAAVIIIAAVMLISANKKNDQSEEKIGSSERSRSRSTGSLARSFTEPERLKAGD